jgi:RimJ/RimL family protein N-acetyltransferase
MLEGKLVRLRPVELSDLERDFAWYNDREVTRFLTVRYPISLTEEERWLRELPPNTHNDVRFAIETRDGRQIGNVGLHEGRPDDRCCSLGISIGDKGYWSQGYGADAIVTLLRFAFGEMGLNRVWLRVFEENERAIACYEKCGFQTEGRLRQHRYQDGRYQDTLVMSMLRSEFEALHGRAPDEGRT